MRSLIIITVALATIGCGATSPTSTGSNTPTRQSATPSYASLPDFIARMQRGTQTTFTATYSTQTEEIKVQQQLPKYYSANTDTYSGSNWTEIRVTDGTSQYVCESTTKTCSAPSGSVSIMDFAGYYVANYWIAKMQLWPTYIPGQYNAVSVTSSTMSLAGKQAQCIMYKNPTETDKICVLANGVLGSVQSKNVTFWMTDFSPTVSQGIFTVPAGYVVAAP